MAFERWLYAARLRLRSLLRRDLVEDDLDDEIRYHLEQRTQEFIATGMAPREAHEAALRAFGGVEQRKEEARDTRRVAFIEDTIRDVRYAARMMRRSPGFTTVAALSLAVGIGGTTSVFSVVDPLLLRRLPVANPDRLVFVQPFRPDDPGPSVSYLEFRWLREHTQSFSAMFVSQGLGTAHMVFESSGDQNEPVRYDVVSGDFFATLGVSAVIGRTFTSADDHPGDPPIVVVSHGFWVRRLASDAQVVGRTLTLLPNTVATIVGVAPEHFAGFEVGTTPDFWLPLRADATDPMFSNRFLRMMAALRREVTREEAQAEVDVVFRQMLDERSAQSASGWTSAQRDRLFAQRLVLESGATGWTRLRTTFNRPLVIVMAAVGSVLLIACANVAALLLARGASRQKEVTIRLAVGGSRGRLIRQLLTESLALATIGGVAGLGVAHLGTRWLLGQVPAQAAAVLDVGPDARILGFTIVASILSAALFGLVPALRATSLHLNPALKERSATSSGSLVLSRVLVGVQVALSLVLLASAGLFVRTLYNLRTLDVGFDKQHVVVFSTVARPGSPSLAPAVQMASAEELLARLEEHPGIRSATIAVNTGLLRGNSSTQRVTVEGYAAQPDEDLRCSQMIVGSRFFETAGIPIIVGRALNPDDEPTEQGPRVAVVSQQMATYFFGAENPIGRTFRFGKNRVDIVGVAKDTKYLTLREDARRAFYVPGSARDFFGGPGFSSVLLAAGDAATLRSAVSGVVTGFDPDLRTTNLQTLNEVVEATLVQERVVTQFSGFFSLLAMLLACVGLYGTLSYSVAQRANEIGIRMALGARVQQVIGMVMRDTSVIVGGGLLVGAAGAVGAAHAISSLLFEVSTSDPWTMAVATAVLVAAATSAAYLPARRAAQVDPMVALRCE